MKVKERESWTLTNEGKGGSKPSFDQFNKSFKGQERNPRANEFASMDVEEYHHYSERAEYKEPEKDSKQQQNNNEQKRQSQQSSSNATRNIVSRVAGTAVSAVVGAVIIVTTYDTIVENEKAAEAPVIETVNWEWNDDYSQANVSFYDDGGNLIKVAPGVITIVRDKEPTCNTEGSMTYTATITENGQEYSNSRQVDIPAFGHDFDEGTVEVIDGKMVMRFRCNTCHEDEIIEMSVIEE